MTDPFQVVLGVKGETLLAAFAGGAASAIMTNGTFRLRLAALCVGMLSAVYLTPFTVEIMSGWTSVAGEPLERGATFLTGVGGMIFVSGFHSVLRRLRQRAPGFLGDRVFPPDD
jgi:hypothetical protein